MSAPPYMQFYIGDYLKDTTELTTTQHGAYLLLLFAMWSRGGYLPDDDAKLAKIAGLRMDQWRRIRPQILPYFRLEGGRLTQARLLQELEAAIEKRTLNRTNGARGGKANAKKFKASRVANASLSLKQPEPEPEREINLSAPSGAERDLSLLVEFQNVAETLARTLKGASVSASSGETSGIGPSRGARPVDLEEWKRAQRRAMGLSDE